jgi:hypothetical protein
MTTPHPKSIRRRLLALLYEQYQKDPLNMLNPEDFLALEGIDRNNLVFNIHYLHDRQLVELMIGYSPPMFAAARITADGIDLIENQFQFDLRFPPMPNEMEEATAEIPTLIERLIEEAELAPLDGEARQCLLRDVQILRDEIARPAERWRQSVLTSVMSWIAAPFDEVGETLPTFTKIATLLKDLPR